MPSQPSTLPSFKTEPTSRLHSKIWGLYTFALCPFCKIGTKLEVPSSTVYTICQQPSTPSQIKFSHSRILTSPPWIQLIQHVILSQDNHCKPLSSIAEEIGIIVNDQTLYQAFSNHGYHCPVACIKPFLSLKAKIKHYNWAKTRQDWMVEHYCKVIWTDGCAFNIGGFSSNTWVTHLPDETYIEDCLVPKFWKLETIILWGCIYSNIKGPLVF